MNRHPAASRLARTASRFAMLTLAFALPAALVAAPASALSIRVDEPDETPPVRDAAAAQHDFAAQLYAWMARTRPAGAAGSFFFSPASIHTALAMTGAGAEGETEDEMARVLGVKLDNPAHHAAVASLLRSAVSAGGEEDRDAPSDDDEQPDFQLLVVNTLWPQKGYPFREDFIRVVEKAYHSLVMPVDYDRPEAARKAINLGIATATRDRIPELLPKGSITPQTRLTLTNAVYLKAKWLKQFPVDRTRDDAEFRQLDGSSVPAPMMSSKKASRRYLRGEAFQLIELPYKSDDGRERSLVLIVPDADDGLPELEKQLTGARLRAWLDDARPRSSFVFMPRFGFGSNFQLGTALAELGMPTAFGRDADFSGMTREEQIRIGAVIHQANLDVDEVGTEAAAATAVTMRAPRAVIDPVEPVVVRADHPFLFLIVERTRARPGATAEAASILFMGRLTEPHPIDTPESAKVTGETPKIKGAPVQVTRPAAP